MDKTSFILKVNQKLFLNFLFSICCFLMVNCKNIDRDTIFNEIYSKSNEAKFEPTKENLLIRKLNLNNEVSDALEENLNILPKLSLNLGHDLDENKLNSNIQPDFKNKLENNLFNVDLDDENTLSLERNKKKFNHYAESKLDNNENIHDIQFNEKPNSTLINNQTSTSSKVFSFQLDENNLINLFWTINYEQKYLTFELKINLPQTVQAPFIVFGFSSFGKFSNADLCILWTDFNLKHHFQDTWTDDNEFINLDLKNDCKLIAYKQLQNHIYIVFERKFDTCDAHDYKIQEGTNHLLWALGDGKLTKVYGLRLSKISRKNFVRLNLLKNLNLVPHLNAQNVKTFNFVVDKVAVPSDETTYWCKINKLPEEFKQKQHIIRYEAIIQKTNEHLVHHMELFHCEVPSDLVIPSYNGLCTLSNRPKILKKCSKVIAAWATGASPLNYPEEAGLSVGKENSSLFVMLEIHYNNPGLLSNLIDSSGLRIYYTNKLRQFDIGILEVGLEYSAKNSIPPGVKQFTLQGHCVPECTRAGLPENGIYIIASQLHTHLSGVQVYTKHFRGGNELDELNRDNYYSTHFQEIRLLKKKVHLMPGDALINYCVYDTSNRSNVTLGGYGIRDEMCVNYIHYYPRIELEVCKSSVDTNSLYEYFKYLKTNHNQPLQNLPQSSLQLDEQHVSTLYKQIQWTPFQIKLLNKFYNTSPLSMQCNRSSGSRFPGEWNGVALTPIYNKLTTKLSDCNSISLDHL